MPERARLLWRGLDEDARFFVVGYVVLLPLFLAPLFATPVLPALDLPFHVAIADMIRKGHGSVYAEHYEARLWPFPPAILWMVLAVVQAKVLVAVYIFIFPIAVAAWARVQGNAASWSLLAFPLAYNLGLHYGFLGYVVSLPVAFATLALEGALLAKTSIPRTIGLAFASCLLYGLHLETYILGAASGIAVALLARASLRHRVLAIVAWLPSAALALAWHIGTPYHRGAHVRTPSDLVGAMMTARRQDLGARSILADLAQRVVDLPVHLLRGFRDGSDRFASLALTAIIAAAFALWFRTRSRDHVLTRARSVLPAIALTAYLALPHHLDEYEAMSIAPRLAPLFVGAAIAVIGPIKVAVATKVFRGAVLALGIGYAAVLLREYRAFAKEVTDFELALEKIPPGHRVVGLVFDAESRVMEVESIFRGLPSLYVARRPSPNSMVALRYCGMRHVPCALRGANVPAPDPWRPERFDHQVGMAMTFFDYIVVRGTAPGLLVDEQKNIVVEKGAWSVYRSDRL